MSELLDEVEMLTLPPGTVIGGPDWHNEVYQKADTDEWFGIASDVPWTSRALLSRGPFTILREVSP